MRCAISLRLASPPGIAGPGGSAHVLGEFSENNTLSVVTESLARCEIVSRIGSPQIWHAATPRSLAAPHAQHKRPGLAPQPRRTPSPPAPPPPRRTGTGRNSRENAEGVVRGLVAAMKSARVGMGVWINGRVRRGLFARAALLRRPCRETERQRESSRARAIERASERARERHRRSPFCAAHAPLTANLPRLPFLNEGNNHLFYF